MGAVLTGDPKSPRRPRVLGWLGALVACLLAPAAAQAQTYTWNQPSDNQDWLVASNWLPSGGPPNGSATVAVFGNVITSSSTVAMSSGVTVGELRFEDVNAGSFNSAYTIGATPLQTITFNNSGSASQLNVTGFVNANQTIAANISIAGGQPLTITNNGAPGVTTLTLSGTISGTSAGLGLNVGGSSDTAITGVIGTSTIGTNVGTLTKSGSGTLTLSGTNLYSGGTVINGGTVSVSAGNNLGAASGGVTLNGGTLQFGVGFGTSRGFTLGANGGTIQSSILTGTTPSVDGAIVNASGATGSLTLDGGGLAGGGFINLTANNTYTGATVINNAGVTLTGNGKLSGTSSLTINGYVGRQVGNLTLDDSSSGSNRVNSAASVTLNGGLIAVVAPLASSGTETFGDSTHGLTVRGFGSIFGTQFNGGFGTTSLTFSSITRSDNFSTLYVGGPIFGASIGSVGVVFTSGVTASSGSGTTIGIVPWIGGDHGAVDSSGFAITATGNAETLYTYNSTTGLIVLDPTSSTNFTQVADTKKFNGGGVTSTNNAIAGDPAAVTGTVTILSLVQNPTSSSSSTITGSGTLKVSSGAIANANVLVFDGPKLDFGSNTGYLYLGNEFVIADTNIGSVGTSWISGSKGLVVSSNSDDSRNTLYLYNTINANTFTGGLYINGTARVAFNTSDSQLGGAGEVISFRGGTLRYTGSDSITLATGGVNRPLVMSAAGGGIISIEGNGTLTVPGVISGSEQLTVLGSGGTLVLTNTNNTYQGGTTLGDATLEIAGSGSLGTGNLTLGVTIGATTYSGGTLVFDNSGTYGFNINHAYSATLNTNGRDVILSGVVSGAGAKLTKAGNGSLTLSAANTYTGDTEVKAGTLLVTNTSGSGTGYGAVTVKAGAALGGTGTVAGSVTVEGSGGTLIAGPADRSREADPPRGDHPLRRFELPDAPRREHRRERLRSTRHYLGGVDQPRRLHLPAHAVLHPELDG